MSAVVETHELSKRYRRVGPQRHAQQRLDRFVVKPGRTGLAHPAREAAAQP